MPSDGFPEETAWLSLKLGEASLLDDLYQDYLYFMSVYNHDKSILRFHYHGVDEIKNLLEDLMRTRRAIPATDNDFAIPEQFITRDEIMWTLYTGGPYENSLKTIREGMRNAEKEEDKADFLKSFFGTGGRSHALSGNDGSWFSYSAKGMTFQKTLCRDVLLKWRQVANCYDQMLETIEP